MALYTVTADSVALAAGTVKSLVELATPSTARCKLVDVSVTFQGIAADAAPVLVELRRATATATGTAFTPQAFDAADGSALVTAKVNASAEGTVASSPLVTWRIHPQAGLVFQFPLGREIRMALSTFLRVRANAAAAVNCAVTVTFEET